MSDDETPTPTPRYRQVLDVSAELARELGHSYIGVEHLFLAIVRDRAAVPTQVLTRITDLDRVEASVREEMASPGYTGEPPAGAVWLSVSELLDLLPALASRVCPWRRIRIQRRRGPGVDHRQRTRQYSRGGCLGPHPD